MTSTLTGIVRRHLTQLSLRMHPDLFSWPPNSTTTDASARALAEMRLTNQEALATLNSAITSHFPHSSSSSAADVRIYGQGAPVDAVSLPLRFYVKPSNAIIIHTLSSVPTRHLLSLGQQAVFDRAVVSSENNPAVMRPWHIPSLALSFLDLCHQAGLDVPDEHRDLAVSLYPAAPRRHAKSIRRDPKGGPSRSSGKPPGAEMSSMFREWSNKPFS